MVLTIEAAFGREQQLQESVLIDADSWRDKTWASPGAQGPPAGAKAAVAASGSSRSSRGGTTKGSRSRSGSRGRERGLLRKGQVLVAALGGAENNGEIAEGGERDALIG